VGAFWAELGSGVRLQPGRQILGAVEIEQGQPQGLDAGGEDGAGLVWSSAQPQTSAQAAPAPLTLKRPPNHLTMRSVGLAQAKAQLSALLDAVESGDEVVITRRGQPVAHQKISGQPT